VQGAKVMNEAIKHKQNRKEGKSITTIKQTTPSKLN